MNIARSAILVLTVLLPALSGCGSSSSPPFRLSCTTRLLPSGAIRAAVTVQNTTSTGSAAYIYGPAFIWIRHIYPFLQIAQIKIQQKNNTASGLAFVVPMVDPKQPAHLLIRFQHPPRRLALQVSDTKTVQPGNASGASTCRVGP